MRISVAALPLVAGLLAASGCSVSMPDDGPPRSASADIAPVRTPACAEVRAGIAAFNAGDYPGTIAHFRLALPLARTQAAKDDSRAAADLVEAVNYYAELAPEDYPESSVKSPEFEKYKQITLGQCSSEDAPSGGSSSEPPGVTT